MLLTEAAPLARHGHLALLARWTDLAAARAAAVQLLVPQMAAARSAGRDDQVTQPAEVG